MRDIRYNVGQFYRFSFLGYRLRVERRRIKLSDLRVGIGTIGMAGALSLFFVAIPSAIFAFLEGAPYIGLFALFGVIFAAWRRIRLSDWFILLYLASYIIAATTLLPILFLGESPLPPLYASAVMFSISLVLFLNLSFFIYILRVNGWLPFWGESST